MPNKKISLDTRLNRTRSMAGLRVNPGIVRRSLKERLSMPLPSGDEHRSALIRYPLQERLKKIQDGESYVETDLTPYIEMINASAAVPLKEMVSTDILFRDIYPLYGVPLSNSITYREAGRKVFDKLEEMERQGLSACIPALPDVEYNTFFVMWDCMINEYIRRTGQNHENTSQYKDISISFPALTIPLPIYFKAAAATFKVPCLKDKLNSLYRDIFRPLLSANPSLSKVVKSNLRFQTEKKTCYSDPITMLFTLQIAYNDKIIDIEEYDELVYDIIILPYLAL